MEEGEQLVGPSMQMEQVRCPLGYVLVQLVHLMVITSSAPVPPRLLIWK